MAQDNKVVTLGYYRGTVKPTDKPFSSEWAMVFTIEGDKIVKFQEFIDTHAVLSAFGVPVHA